MCEHNASRVRAKSRMNGQCRFSYPDSLLLGGSSRVVGTQALWVIAVTALITLKQLLLQ